MTWSPTAGNIVIATIGIVAGVLTVANAVRWSPQAAKSHRNLARIVPPIYRLLPFLLQESFWRVAAVPIGLLLVAMGVAALFVPF